MTTSIAAGTAEDAELVALREAETAESPVPARQSARPSSLCEPLLNVQLSPTPSAFSPEDWWAFNDERAAIREFDGKTPRSEAEALALQDTVAALGPCPPNT